MKKVIGWLIIILGILLSCYMAFGYVSLWITDFFPGRIALFPVMVVLWLGPGILLMSLGNRIRAGERVWPSEMWRKIKYGVIAIIAVTLEISGLLAAWFSGIPSFILALFVPPIAIIWGAIALLRGYF